jgi:hypothetical protein
MSGREMGIERTPAWSAFYRANITTIAAAGEARAERLVCSTLMTVV